jgi:hypothetical protein
VEVDFPGISRLTLVGLRAFSRLACRVLTLDESWVEQIPDLGLDLPGCVFDADDASDWAGYLTLDVNQSSFSVDFDNFLSQRGGALVTHMSRHLFTLENLSRIFAHTNGTGGSVGLTDTVRGVLHSKVPSFNDTLVTLTL